MMNYVKDIICFETPKGDIETNINSKHIYNNEINDEILVLK